MARYFGTGIVSIAFSIAFMIPNLFRKLLGEGALSSAFIPLYAKSVKSESLAEANQFAAASVNMLSILLVGLTLIGEAILWATGHWFSIRPQYLLTVRLTQIMLPYVVLICGTAFLSGILQVHKRFALPALTPVLLNIMHIAVIVIGARILWLSTASDAEKIILQTRLAYWLSGFVLVAGVLQIAMLAPSLAAVGFRPLWAVGFWTPAVRKMLELSLPLALTTGVLQLSVVIDKGITLFFMAGENSSQQLHWLGHTLAYPMAFGAVARLNWAQLLYQFPLGVFAIALATAIFPNLGADAADNPDQFKRVLRQGMIFSLLEGIPASAGLILIRYPAVRLLFQHGNFTAVDTRWTALSLAIYSAGIWAFSIQQIINRAYYARHNMMTPLKMSILTIAVNTIVEVPLAFTRLGESAMAVGTLASFAVQAVIMLFMLDREVGGIGLGRIAFQTAKMIVACAAMCAACLAVEHLNFFPSGVGHWASVEQLAILVTVGGATYGLLCLAMGLRTAH
jgi:putative peptidoglycan lipid II flippase